MSVAFVAAGAMGLSSTVTPITVTAPACAVGDLMICFLYNNELTVTISPPDGTWTQIFQNEFDTGVAASRHRYAAFWKIATASGASFSFSKSADNNVIFAGVIAVWNGHDSGSPIDATAVGESQNASADNVTFPAFDPTHTDVEVVFAAFYANDLTTFNAAMSADTNPDCTTRFDLETSAGNDCTIAVTSGTNDGSNVASRTWASASTTDAPNTGVVFAIKAAGGGGGASIVPIIMAENRMRRRIHGWNIRGAGCTRRGQQLHQQMPLCNHLSSRRATHYERYKRIYQAGNA